MNVPKQVGLLAVTRPVFRAAALVIWVSIHLVGRSAQAAEIPSNCAVVAAAGGIVTIVPADGSATSSLRLKQNIVDFAVFTTTDDEVLVALALGGGLAVVKVPDHMSASMSRVASLTGVTHVTANPLDPGAVIVAVRASPMAPTLLRNVRADGTVTTLTTFPPSLEVKSLDSDGIGKVVVGLRPAVGTSFLLQYDVQSGAPQSLGGTFNDLTGITELSDGRVAVTDNDPSGQGRLFLFDRVTRQQIRLTGTPPGRYLGLTLRESGNALLLVAPPGAINRQLYIVNLTTGVSLPFGRPVSPDAIAVDALSPPPSTTEARLETTLTLTAKGVFRIGFATPVEVIVSNTGGAAAQNVNVVVRKPPSVVVTMNDPACVESDEDFRCVHETLAPGDSARYVSTFAIPNTSLNPAYVNHYYPMLPGPGGAGPFALTATLPAAGAAGPYAFSAPNPRFVAGTRTGFDARPEIVVVSTPFDVATNNYRIDATPYSVAADGSVSPRTTVTLNNVFSVNGELSTGFPHQAGMLQSGRLTLSVSGFRQDGRPWSGVAVENDPLVYLVPGTSKFSQTGHVDGDGFDDIVLVTSDPAGDNQIVVLVNNGADQFTSVVTPLSIGLHVVVDAQVVDVNGDGRQDVALLQTLDLETTREARLTIYHASADGSYSEGPSYLVSGFATQIAGPPGDLSGDGRPDFLVRIDDSLSDRLEVLQSDDQGGYALKPATLPVDLPGLFPGNQNVSAAVFDIDGGGILEFLGQARGTSFTLSDPAFGPGTVRFGGMSFEQNGNPAEPGPIDFAALEAAGRPLTVAVGVAQGVTFTADVQDTAGHTDRLVQIFQVVNTPAGLAVQVRPATADPAADPVTSVTFPMVTAAGVTDQIPGFATAKDFPSGWRPAASGRASRPIRLRTTAQFWGAMEVAVDLTGSLYTQPPQIWWSDGVSALGQWTPCLTSVEGNEAMCTIPAATPGIDIAVLEPVAGEICDGNDNDGDGQVDEGFPDTDGDARADCVDNCPLVPNPSQADTDSDGTGDVCDPDTAEAAAAIVPPGGTLTTDTEGDGATPADFLETSVTLPADSTGGTVNIAEMPVGAPAPLSVRAAAAPEGVTLLGQQVSLSAPNATAASPLTLLFRHDASVIPRGFNKSRLLVFRDGAQVPDCAVADGRATPDPCVASRARLADRDLELTVLTSRASVWSFGLPTDDIRCRVSGDGVIDEAQPKRFALLVHTPTDARPPRTRATYRDPSAGKFFAAVEVTRLTCVGTRADIVGKARVNGMPVDFTLQVEDRGAGGAGDAFTIRWPGYEASGSLAAGDIVVRTP